MQPSTPGNIRYDAIAQIRTILRDQRSIRKLYEGSPSSLSEFLLTILADKTYDLIARSEIAGDELYKIVNNEDDSNNSEIIITDKKGLQVVLLECLKDRMAELKKIDDSIITLYLKNLEDIKPGSRKIVITQDANKTMKEFVMNYPHEYLRKYFLREFPSFSIKGKRYNLDPFLTSYFSDSWEDIKSFILSSNVKNIFEKSELELKFYNYLVEATQRAEKSTEEHRTFLVTDESFISTVSQFIILRKN